MKRFVLIIGFLMSITLVWADNLLTGKVLDKDTRQAIDFANVSVSREGESTPLDGTTTDAEGRFSIGGLSNGTYTLQVQFLGYISYSKAITLHGAKLDVGNILLAEDAQQLKEVEVVGQGSTMRFELDKKVFTVDQNISSAGASITDVLENIPSVEVDQEGNISLRNSENVEIWINGKPAGLDSENRGQVLQQLPAESIKQIEVITNPSAKYSPEGTAGIINLVMKEERKAGYFGSIAAGINYGLAAPWNVPPGGNLGINFHFTKSIVDGYFNAGYRYHTSNGGTTTDRHNTNDSTRLQQTSENNRQGGGLFLRAGLNIHMSQYSTLGLSGFGMVSDAKVMRHNNHNLNHYLLTDEHLGHEGDTLRYYDRLETGGGWHPGGQALIDYTFRKQAHQLIVSAEYKRFLFNQENQYTQSEIGRDTLCQEQLSYNTNQGVTIKADYEWKPTQQSRLEAGYQASLGWQTSQASAYDGMKREKELYAYYTTFSNKEQTHALYITYGNRFWDKLSVQVGLRGEYFMRHLESTYKDASGTICNSYDAKPDKQDTAYFQLFPSAYISYDFGDGHELQLNYTRRVDRPRGHQINPRMNFADSTNISYGNPELLPSYSSSLELNYLKTWERHTLSAGLFWRYNEGTVQNVKYMTGDVMKNTWINIANRQELGGEIVAKNRLFGELLQLTTSVNLYWNTLSEAHYTNYLNGEPVDILLPAQNILAWSARLNAQFMFTKTFSGQISGQYHSPRVVAQGETSHNYSIDLGLRKTFLNKSLVLALNVRDLLDSRARRNTTYGEGFEQFQIRRWHSRSIGLNITYNFGNSPKRKDGPMRQQDENMNDGGMDEGGEY